MADMRRGEGFEHVSLTAQSKASQRLASVVLGLSGHAGIRRTIEAPIHVALDRHSGAAQSIRIGPIFVGQEMSG
jgi:hypothetical protein